MHKTFDLNILPLVAAIKAFDGLTVIGGCAGHPDPRPDQWPKDTWYVMFVAQQSDQGWFALEFVAWAINNDYRRGGHQALLLPIAPPPYLNEPGRSLQFVIEGSVNTNATALAAWLDQLRAECYVAPQDGLATRETPADWFGGIPQGG